jgi:hypothetical protein
MLHQQRSAINGTVKLWQVRQGYAILEEQQVLRRGGGKPECGVVLEHGVCFKHSNLVSQLN